ncbi:uncharacterized protein TNCV_728571 [Trichonephila clavipes]|nr:uncharacterized protein TNCV_728571 [Trichonephila clavipes]
MLHSTCRNSPPTPLVKNSVKSTPLASQEMECAAFHSRRESITDESPTSFPEENTSLSYSGFEPTRLQAKGHIHHTGWATKEDMTTRGLLATDHVILNHGQVTWTTPELAPPLLTTTPHQREDVSALDRFNVHRCPTRRVFSGTGLEPVTKQATVRYLYHSATAAAIKLGSWRESDVRLLTVSSD